MSGLYRPKLLILALAASVLLLVFSLPVLAGTTSETVSITLDNPNSSVKVGKELTVDVKATIGSTALTSGVSGYKIVITYDSSKLSFVPTELGDDPDVTGFT